MSTKNRVRLEEMNEGREPICLEVPNLTTQKNKVMFMKVPLLLLPDITTSAFYAE
jgi:hypothetical protein